MTADHQPNHLGSERNSEPPDKKNANELEARYTQEQLDLLVDGELDGQDRKDLLRKLDRSPDGWKHCALAFLEAQMFQQAIRQEPGQGRQNSSFDLLLGKTSPETSVEHARTSSEYSHEEKISDAKKQQRNFSRQLPMTIVLSLAAFLLGGLLFSNSSDSFRPNQQVSDPVGETTNIAQTNPNVPASVSMNDQSLSDYAEEFFVPTVSNSPFVAIAPKKQPLQVGVPKTEYIILPSANGHGETVVPCYLASEIQAYQYLKAPALISTNELSRIFPLGGEIDVKRESYVVPAGENRHAIIPVDQVIVKYNPRIDIL